MGRAMKAKAGCLMCVALMAVVAVGIFIVRVREGRMAAARVTVRGRLSQLRFAVDQYVVNYG